LIDELARRIHGRRHGFLLERNHPVRVLDEELALLDHEDGVAQLSGARPHRFEVGRLPKPEHVDSQA